MDIAKPDSLGEQDETDRQGVELKTAARFLRITPDALRKRIERGAADAYKEGGRWFVVLDATDRPGVEKRTKRTQQSTDDLMERIVTLTEQMTRYKVLCEVSESTQKALEADYKNQIAELQAEVTALRSRRWWKRTKSRPTDKL